MGHGSAEKGQHLIFDADDTLWENNIHFERAIEDFLDFLAHSTLTREEARVHRPRVVRVDAKNRLIAAYDADEEPGEILNSIDPTTERPGVGSA